MPSRILAGTSLESWRKELQLVIDGIIRHDTFPPRPTPSFRPFPPSPRLNRILPILRIVASALPHFRHIFATFFANCHGYALWGSPIRVSRDWAMPSLSLSLYSCEEICMLGSQTHSHTKYEDLLSLVLAVTSRCHVIDVNHAFFLDGSAELLCM